MKGKDNNIWLRENVFHNSNMNTHYVKLNLPMKKNATQVNSCPIFFLVQPTGVYKAQAIR